MFKSTSNSMIATGILAVIVGIIALAWPGVTVLALVILFAVYAFIAAGLQAMRAFSSDTAGPVFGHLLLGLVDIAAGIIALAWPGPTALVLVLIVAIWAFIGGFLEIFAAFESGETAGTRALFIIGGLVSIAFGAVLFAHPGLGAITLALLFGLFSLIYGVSQIVTGFELRRTGHTLHSVMENAA
ncbi:MAG: HdeD family acid-resistance protein [Streptosporangiaceae bacterium]